MKNENQAMQFCLVGTENGINIIFDELEHLFLKRKCVVHRYIYIPSQKEIEAYCKIDNLIWILGIDLYPHTDDFIKNLNNLKMKSIAILDAWKGTNRFWNINGSEKILPKILLVPDMKIKEFLEKKLQTKILTYKNPLIESLSLISKKQKSIIRKGVYNKLKININKPNLIFVSEPLQFSNDNFYSPLTGYKVKKSNIHLLQHIENNFIDTHNLIIRKHPIEMNTKHTNWIDGDSLSFKELVSISDLVVGKASTLILIFYLCGVKVENRLECINWSPKESNYENEIWDHLDKNLFKRSSTKHFSKFLGKESVLEIVFSI